MVMMFDVGCTENNDDDDDGMIKWMRSMVTRIKVK